jgi:hypothetical protein
MKYSLMMIFGVAALAQTPAADAVSALRGLNSVTEAGINFRDYSTRLLDAKVKVDQYLTHAPKSTATQRMITILQMYVLARMAWGATITKDYYAGQAAAELAIATPDVMACPGIAPRPVQPEDTEEQRRQRDARWKNSLATQIGNPTILWKCAAQKLAAFK